MEYSKGSNENTNGLLKGNFPKKANSSTVRLRDLCCKGVYRISNRLRKSLGGKTAQKCLAGELRSPS